MTWQAVQSYNQLPTLQPNLDDLLLHIINRVRYVIMDISGSLSTNLQPRVFRFWI